MKLTESHRVRSEMIHYIFEAVADDYVDVDQHETRVMSLVAETKGIFGLSAGEHALLLEAARYHDVGLVSVDREVANKPSSLTEDEKQEIHRHAECGYRILSAISEYSSVADIILAHHEWYDGTGYPKNLRGGEIPLLSRILSILDAYDAMTHPRIYKEQYTQEEAIRELEIYSGTQFDPELTRLFMAYLKGSASM